MSPFMRSIPQVLRLPRLPLKFRRLPPKPDDATISMDAPCGLLRNVPEPAPNSVLPPSTVAGVDEVEESVEPVTSDSAQGDLEVDDNQTEVNDVDEEEFDTEDEDADSDAEDADPCDETFSFDLARKTRIEMMVHSLYVALSDDPREIAALRTRSGEQFTRIVRITFEAPSTDSDATLSPSAWKREANFPSKGPFELCLRCPAFARNNESNTALTHAQLLFARRFITLSLPYRHDAWLDQGVKFPFSEEQCAEARLLIVGPADRSVDVMAVLVSYLTSLTGASAAKLLDSLKKFDFEHAHWRDYARANFAVAPVIPNPTL